MKRPKSAEGFFLLDAVISLFVVSFIIIEIFTFVLSLSSAAVKTNDKIIKSIETGNRSAVELFEKIP